MKTDQGEKGISEIVGVFTDPVIVYPSGWEDTLPDWIKTAITLERLIESMKSVKGQEPTGTNAEALAYLYPASLAFPLSRDWTEIYLYLGKTVMEYHNPFHKEEPFPADLKVRPLEDDQVRELNRLKAWLYSHRNRSRIDRDRTDRREKKEEVAAQKKEAQPALFDF